MSDSIAIRVLNESCESCASAVLLCRCRSDSSGKTNQMLQKYSGLLQDVQDSSYKGEQGFLYLRVRVRRAFRC